MTAFTVMGFVWLSHASLEHVKREQPAYSEAEVESLAALTAETTKYNALLRRLVQVESGGDPYAVSRKGARGLAQIMPHTGRDPGYGVAPLRDDSTKEQLRFASDYLDAMERRYGNIRLALAAYNCGPACVDSGRLPQETREYVSKVLGE
jgi:soluble lytic murein transglycosylase-like protein